MAYLELRNVEKKFSGVTAVQDFNLAADKGEFVSLLGPSGCGKTTTLRMIAGFETPDFGDIYLDNAVVTSMTPDKRGIGMVFQGYALFPNLNVRDNVAFGLDVARRPKKEVDERVMEMLALVRMKDMAKRYPFQLSGGQQQRVALARALAIHPRILLLDEPLSALDAVVRVALREEIRRIQLELGITTIYVTHDQEEALSMSDRVVIMKDGLIEQIGSPGEIYRQPQTIFVAGFIGTANQLRGELIEPDVIRFANTPIRFPATILPTSGIDHGKLVVLVRPENIQLTPARPTISDKVNLLEGQIVTVTFLGSTIRVAVDVNGERVIVAAPASQNQGLARQQRVWLAFAPEECQALAE